MPRLHSSFLIAVLSTPLPASFAHSQTKNELLPCSRTFLITHLVTYLTQEWNGIILFLMDRTTVGKNFPAEWQKLWKDKD